MLPSKTFAAASLIFLSLFSFNVFARTSASVLNWHGGPGTTGTCAGCHNGNVYTHTDVSFTCSSIEHNTTTTCSIGLNGSNALGSGINLSIYQGSTEQAAGLLSLTSGETALSLRDSDKELSSTLRQTANFKWTFDFNAPDSPGTAYTLYYCIIQTDGDTSGFDSGDGPEVCSSEAITVINSAPNAVNDTSSTDSSLEITESGSVTFNVLGNDTDTGGDVPSIASFDQSGTTGSVTDNGGGSFTYNTNGQFETLAVGESTTDTFTYTIQDNHGASDAGSTATVTITINGQNDAPIAAADSIAVERGATATELTTAAGSVLFNDSDEETASLSLTAVLDTSPAFAATNGFTFNANGTFSYTHNGTDTQADSFTYHNNDGFVDSGIVTVSITIATNDRPEANNDPTAGPASVLEGGSVVIDLLSNDVDPENQPLSITNLEVSPANGMVVDNGNGTVTYTHNGSETLSDTFSYTANDGLQDSLTAATVSITVTSVNEPPAITSSAIIAATEDELYEYQVEVFDPDLADADVATAITFTLENAPATMAINSTGLITWTPPRTGTFNDSVGPITLTVEDGGEDLVQPVIPVTQVFSIAVNPPDEDEDLIPDYSDNCPADGSSTDQTDTDNDGEGDLCDSDDDNDGISDTEELALGFDPLVASILTIPDDIITDSTGYLTEVVIGQATLAENGLALQLSNDAPDAFKSGHTVVTWSAGSVSLSNTQSVDVVPLINFYPDQTVLEGNAVQIKISLNGEAVTYPVTVDYTLTGSADAADHDLVNGAITIASGTETILNISTVADALVEGTENLILTLSNPANAVLGPNLDHTVFINETNIAPLVNISVDQNGSDLASIYKDQGSITVTANVTDSGDTHSFDWSQSDNALIPVPPATASLIIDPDSLTAGSYLISVDVSDNDVTVNTERYIQVLDATPALATDDTKDSDNDGINNDVEGLADADNDLIPDYLDANPQPELLPNQTGDADTTYLLQTETGLNIQPGAIAILSGRYGSLISEDDIINNGGANSGVTFSDDDDHAHFGGIYDFTINNLIPGSSTMIVIPLQSKILNNSIYHKFNLDFGWQEFVVDVNNAVYSAVGMLGVCPAPGSDLYTAGLTTSHYCVQLKIQDGGPNDTDGLANGSIQDPGGVTVKNTADSNTTETPAQSNGSIGIINPVLLFMFIFLYALKYNKRK